MSDEVHASGAGLESGFSAVIGGRRDQSCRPHRATVTDLRWCTLPSEEDAENMTPHTPLPTISRTSRRPGRPREQHP